MKKIRAFILTAMTLAGLIAVPALPVYAQTCSGAPADCISQGESKVSNNGPDGGASLQDSIKTIVNVMLFILGAIAVIMIIVGGIRYATSGGDASQTKAAKDTILYAVIGLVVAILAYAIVNFVVGAFSGKS